MYIHQLAKKLVSLMGFAVLIFIIILFLILFMYEIISNYEIIITE